MKMIYSSRNPTECDLVHAFLQGVGVQSMLKNEYASRTAGVGIIGGLPFAWPDVWVNDEDFDEAQECLKNSGLSDPQKGK